MRVEVRVMVHGSWFRVAGFRVQGSGFRRQAFRDSRAAPARLTQIRSAGCGVWDAAEHNAGFSCEDQPARPVWYLERGFNREFQTFLVTKKIR